MNSSPEGHVIVIGAGPVGMTTALLLAARRISVTIVERRRSSSDEPKAISIDDESLRVYQQAGVIEQVLSIIVPGTGTMYFDSAGQELFHARSAQPFRLSYPFKNPFAQPDLERVLKDAIEQDARIDVRFGTALVDLSQTQDGVEVVLDSQGKQSRLHGDFLVAADGGRSTVRSRLGIPMIGKSFDDLWVVIDTRNDHRHERYGMHHGDPRRPHVVVPGLHGRCRYEFYTYPGETGDGPPPFDLIRRLVAPYRSITPEDIERAVGYRFHALNALRWRVGRVFLVGDAAHMMPPFAGQGLNSGIRDALNLSWKIAHAIASPESSDRVLESYQSERRPQAEAVISSSVRLGRVVMTTDERIARFRDERIRAAMTTPEGREFFEHMMYRPPSRIEAGIVLPAPDARLVGSQLAQPTVFDFRRHRIVPLDSVLGQSWSIVAVGLDAARTAAASHLLPELAPKVVAIPLDDLIEDHDSEVEVAIDLDGRLYEEFEPERGRYLLVRPDRFVAAEWRPAESSAIADSIRRLLGFPAPVLIQ